MRLIWVLFLVGCTSNPPCLNVQLKVCPVVEGANLGDF